MYNILESNNADGYIVLDNSDIRYFSKLTSSNIALLITKNESFVFSDSRYKYRIESQSLFTPVVCGGNLFPSICSKIKELGLKRILVDPGHLTYAQYSDNLEEMKEKLIFKKGITKELRAIKRADEIKNIKTAQTIAEASLREIFPIIKEGITTSEIAAKLELSMSMKGSEEPSFSTIVLSGAKSADCHGVPDNTPVKANEFILFDFGATVNGYRSDMTRTVVLGEPSEFMNNIYNIVLTAHEKSAAFLKAGITAKEADKKARDYISDNGYGEVFLHSLGHGVGLDIHEYPTLSSASETILLPGMAVTVEPGIYLKDKFGVRIEDTYIVEEKGSYSLAEMEKSLIKLK